MESPPTQPVHSPHPAEPARARLESHRAVIESLLQQIIQHAHFQLSFVIRPFDSTEKDIEDPEWVVDFSGADSDVLLEANAELLNALEYIVLKAARLEEELFTKITFDCQEWRRLRIEELKLMAEVAADRVSETGDPFPLGHMTARERRVVHLALRDRPAVRTESQGAGAERRVVILPTSPPTRRR